MERLFNDFVADCLADVQERHRTEDRRAALVGWGQGAMLAHFTATHRPELVREYFAYAGWNRRTIGDEIAAATAGLSPGDVITAHNGRPVGSRDDLVAAMASVVSGQTEVTVAFSREDQERESTVRPGPLGVVLADR